MRKLKASEATDAPASPGATTASDAERER